jgi:hypothetical protein
MTINIGASGGSSDLIAYCAVLVSVFSLAISIWAVLTQRKHNRNSLKPIAQITLGDYLGELYVRIDNNGTGPLLIKQFEATSHEGSFTSLIMAVDANIRSAITWVNFVEEIDSKAILPGKSLTLIKAELNPILPTGQITREEQQWALLRSCLAGIMVTVTFTDIYGKKFAKVQRALNWFGRNKMDNLAMVFSNDGKNEIA